MADEVVNVKVTRSYPLQPTTKSTTVLAPHQSALEGQVDIPDATADETEIEIPFGTIDAATTLLIENTNNQDMGIRLNGADADIFRLAPGGLVLIAMPVAPGGTPIASASVVTTAAQDEAGKVKFLVAGDPTG